MIDWWHEIHSCNPYEGFPAGDFAPDYEGFGYDAEIFEDLIAVYKPARIVEVGSWKGSSAIRTARLLHQYEVYDPQILCVDTFLGSVEHWLQPGHTMKVRWGRPQLYEIFMANVIRAGETKTIIPFPVDSITAARVVAVKGFQADAIYLDASHAYEDVMGDLIAWWPILRVGGVLLGDDYEDRFAGLVRAVNEFASRLGQSAERPFSRNKFMMEKHGS